MPHASTDTLADAGEYTRQDVVIAAIKTLPLASVKFWLFRTTSRPEPAVEMPVN